MKNVLVLSLLICILCGPVACSEGVSPPLEDVVANTEVTPSQAPSGISDDDELRDLLWNYINNGSFTTPQTAGILAPQPFYSEVSGSLWYLFPATSGQSPTAYKNRRLGLPVHGRWITSYVNDVALSCIRDGTGCQSDPGSQTRRLLPGSIM